MMVHHGCFSLEVVEAVNHQKCHENTEPNSGEVFVQVDPKAHYFIRLCVVGGVAIDPERVFLAYVNINDEYVGYRQCLSQRQGYKDVGVCSTIVGINQPIRFQQAKLLETSDGFHSNILHMGKVTVKIYEGICDRRQSAFGNNVFGNEAYQPGRFVDSMTIHCCASPEAGHAYLNPADAERLRLAFMKRPTDNEGPQHFKRVKTETGYVTVSNAGGGMECDMVMQPQAYPLA